MDATELSAGLREFADWCDDHPEYAKTFSRVEAVAYSPDNVESVRGWAKVLGRCEKDYRSDLFTLRRMFGPLKVEATVWRSTVCEKVVTTEEVTEMVPDPRFTPDVPMIEVTRTVETVTWECKPILEEVTA